LNGDGLDVDADVNLAGLDVDADVDLGTDLDLDVDVDIGGLPGLDVDLDLFDRDSDHEHDVSYRDRDTDINQNPVNRSTNNQSASTGQGGLQNRTNNQQSTQAASSQRGVNGGGGAGASAVAARGCGSRDDQMGVDLVTGTQYTSGSVSNWARMSSVRVVDLDFCPAVERQISSTLRNSGLSSWLQQAVSHHSGMRQALAQADIGVSDVIAIRDDGSTLWVFAH
jgi:hypothetical protein